MQSKIYIWLTLGIGLLVLTSTAVAQEEQWLQYHSEREARRIVGDMSMQTLALSTQKPAGVELPEFKGEGQFFAKWLTPMVESGYLQISFDRTHKSGLYDLLYIDSNGNGHLNDETAVTAYRTDRYSAYFGPVKVVFEGEDGPVTYHLNFRFSNYNERNRRLYAYSGGWYEGDITVKGAKKHCTLIDYNANGTFDDKSINSRESDRIRVGKKGGRDTRFVGNYIEIDDVLYRPEIARDGAYIKLSKAEDVKFGNIRLPETINEFSAGGENGLFILKPEKGTGSLPVGKYRINYWAIERKDEKGKKWKLEGRMFSQNGDFEITETAQTPLEIGEPVIGGLRVNIRGGNYDFSKNLRGRLGEYVSLTRNGRRMTEMAKMHVKDKNGTFHRTYPMPDQ